MTTVVDGLGLGHGAGEMAVERALAEVRAGRGVRLVAMGGVVLVMGAETWDARTAAALAAAGASEARLVLPAPRLLKLGAPRAQAGSVLFLCTRRWLSGP